MRYELQVYRFRIAIWGYLYDGRIRYMNIAFNTKGTTPGRGYIGGHTILRYRSEGLLTFRRVFWLKTHHLTPLYVIARTIRKYKMKMWYRIEKGKAHYLKLKPLPFVSPYTYS